MKFPVFWCYWKERSSQTIEIPKEFLMFSRAGAEALNPCKIGGILGKQLNSCYYNDKSEIIMHFMEIMKSSDPSSSGRLKNLNIPIGILRFSAWGVGMT